jgi:hypothetical protein
MAVICREKSLIKRVEKSLRKIIQGNAEEIYLPAHNEGKLLWVADNRNNYISSMKNIYIAEAGETVEQAYKKILDLLDVRLKATDFILWNSRPEITRLHKLEYGMNLFLITARYSIPDIEVIK